MFITIDMEDNHPVNTVPAGFEGYSLRNSGISGITETNVYYKTEYFSTDSKFKTYLGLSEQVFDDSATAVTNSDGFDALTSATWNTFVAKPV